MSWDTIRYEVRDGVAAVTLDRPDKLNAISDRMIEELDAALDRVRGGEARALLLTGAGRAFSAGGDLSEIGDSYGGSVGYRRHMEQVTDFVLKLTDLPVPTVAAVNGIAAGAGANLALACDFVLMAETAALSEIFSTIGLVGDWGGMYFLPRLVGRQRAKELIFSGRMVAAAECLTLGLALEVLPPDALLKRGEAVARQYARGPTAAYALAKRVLNRSFESDQRSAMDAEGLAQVTCGLSRDHREALQALREKRPPRFEGN